jgi:hypothetical protein
MELLLSREPSRYKQYAYESVERSKSFATHPMKEEVISPTMMYFLYPMEKELDGYPRREFVQDVLNEVQTSTSFSSETADIYWPSARKIFVVALPRE